MAILFNDRNLEKLKTEKFILEHKTSWILEEQKKQRLVLEKLLYQNDMLVESNERLLKVLTTLVEKISVLKLHEKENES